MKTKHFLLLILSVLSLSLISCEKDGDGGSGDKSIVGEWRLYKDYEEGYGYEYYDEDDDEYQYYLIFKSNGTMKIIEIEEGEEWEESGTYTLSGERLKVKFDGETEYVDIASLTSDELVLDWSDEDGKYLEYYERVD